MKVIIVIRISEQQLELGRMLEEIVKDLGFEPKLLNLDASDNYVFIQHCIRAEKAQLLMTIDCVGFDLRLLGDDLFYNSLCIPAMHFVTGEPDNKKEELSMRMNFNMEFYCFNEDDTKYIVNNFHNIREVHTIECGCTSLLGKDKNSFNTFKNYIGQQIEYLLN